MKLAYACLLTVLLGAISLRAQTQTTDAAQPTRAVVAGIVTKDPGSEPLKKALIELIAESQSDGGNYTALTGADGSFRIENIVPGRYRLFVERTGYQEIDKHRRRPGGRVLTMTAGQEMKDVVIRLQAAAVVEGRVTDEDGDPMPEAQVAVMRQTFVAGRSHWEAVGAERTNDLGEYRIAGLAAGSYFVSATPPPDFRSLIETTSSAAATAHNSAATDKPAPSAYQTTYYPGTRDRGQAAPIQLHAGDDFPVSFSLTPSPSLTIRGSVVNLPPGATAAIMLQSKDFNLVLNGAEMRKDGSFEIRDISPGAYTILATVDNVAVAMMARQSLQIAESVEGIRLAPQTGGTIRGRMQMDAGGKARPDASQMFLLLRSTDGDDDALGSVTIGEGFSNLAHVNSDGSFEWKNVPAGRYSVQIADASAMPDWFLKSVAAGGREAVDFGFSVSGGVTALNLVASANGAIAEGIATNQKDEPLADAVVVAVPAERFRNHPERYRKGVTDQSGRFTLRGLPPGDYTILAWESVDGEAYYNSEFLKSFEGQGRLVHLEEGRRASVTLKAIPSAEDEP
ncbi:MAG TPA: carboxypeptidase-like regulatory domain-containing protein [Candidatus Sulfotelmatobacter sp.]|nr:carboxypeptidase-like regulatory domain-containing protein [Candidatus Sulfotelmatobacter sp.]